MDDANLFERTADGWDEIKHKSHGLTQSERLVLILVDGKSTLAEMRVKAPSLKLERFNLALQKLCDLGLVVEQMLQPDVPVLTENWPEAPTPDEVQRFLQQDKLDPVSVILQDSVEEVADEELVPNTQFQMDEQPFELPVPASKAPALPGELPDVLPDLTAPTLPVDNLIDEAGRAVKPEDRPDWERRAAQEDRRAEERRQAEERRYRKSSGKGADEQAAKVAELAAQRLHQVSFAKGLFFGAVLGAALASAYFLFWR